MFKLFFLLLATSSLITSAAFSMDEPSSSEEEYRRPSRYVSPEKSKSGETLVRVLPGQYSLLTDPNLMQVITDEIAPQHTYLTHLTPGPDLTDKGLAHLTKLKALDLRHNEGQCTIKGLLSLPQLEAVALSATPSDQYYKKDLKVLLKKGVNIENTIIENLLAKLNPQEDSSSSSD